MDTHATIEELLEAVFSTWSVPRLYNEKQLLLWDSLEPAARERGPELWNPEAEDIVGIRCQAVPSEDTAD
jgi:hypothetical protein